MPSVDPLAPRRAVTAIPAPLPVGTVGDAAPARLHRPATLPEWVALALVVGWGIACSIWLVLLGSGLGTPGVIAQVIPLLGGAYFAGRVARAEVPGAGAQRWWWMVTAAQLLLIVALVVEGMPLSLTRPALAPLLRVLLLLAAQLALLAGLLALEEAPRERLDRTRMWIDVATVSVGGLVVAAYDITAVPGHERLVFGLMHGVAAGYLALILVASTVWQRTTSRTRRVMLVLVCAAFFLGFVSHAFELLAEARPGWSAYWATRSAPLTGALLALAAWLPRSGDVPTRHTATPMPRGMATASLIPFLALLPGFGLVWGAAYHVGAKPLQELVVGSVVLTLLAFIRHSTASREAARALADLVTRESEARFRSLVQHSSDVITIVTPDGSIRWVSPAATAVFGYAPETLAGRLLTDFVHPDDRDGVTTFLEELVAAPGQRGATASGIHKREWRLRHASGTWMTVDNVATNLLDEPTVHGLVLNTRDVTEESAIKAQYMHQAFHDPLTDLANRALFLYQVGHALARAHRQGRRVTVLFLDLDNFKTVNDSLGHAAGDRLLVEAARRLATCVRDSDLIARLGGDEFAVLVEDAEHDEDVEWLAGRIGDVVRRPFLLGGQEVFVSASIGIASAAGRENSDDLVRNADVAMYVAKTSGKGRHVVFEPAMHEAAVERLVLEADLRQAIERREFVLQYQPIVDLTTGAVYGAEALVRWRSGDRGTVPPGVFIPLAEETGLVVPIGRWVLHEACRTAAQWRRERGHALRVSVNLSGRQLLDNAIVEDVRTALADAGLPPHLLVLELTETMLMRHTDILMARLTSLKALGVSIAIDDFGTGYSSLSYLQRYPIDILKIDKDFVDAMLTDQGGPVLAKAIVTLGETLRLHTVAEGIETDAQRGHLLELGCQLGQGFLFAPALDPAEFEGLLLARGVAAPDVAPAPSRASREGHAKAA